ncbi:MAG: NUDIX domain-containing protein [Chlamydiota bacterium]
MKNYTEDCFHLGVKALIPNRNGKLLVLQMNPKKFKDTQKSYWDLPGGRIQKNESLEEALKREVYEETGLQNVIPKEFLLMTLSSKRIFLESGDVGLIYATYLCEAIDESPIHVSVEHVHFDWLEPKKVANLLTSYPEALREKINCLLL